MLRPDLVALELAAETVDECLSLFREGLGAGLSKPAIGSLAEIRVVAWESALAQDSSGYLARRVQEAGISVYEITRALRQLPVQTPASGWSMQFEQLVKAYEAGERDALPYPFPSYRFAFGQVLWPICGRATDTLKASGFAPESALGGFHTWLLTRLVEFCAPALYGAFAKFRAAQTGGHQKGVVDRRAKGTPLAG